MARIRTIKPEFWGSPKTARVSRDARLLFIGLLNESDDEGRQLGSPKRIVGALFPHDDNVTVRLISAWLDELEREGFLHRYEVNSITYIEIAGFTEHQRVSHPTPSRLPAFSGGVPEPIANGSGRPPESVGPDLGRDLGRDHHQEDPARGSPDSGCGEPPDATDDATTQIQRSVLERIADQRLGQAKNVRNRPRYRAKVLSELLSELDIAKLHRLIVEHPGAPIDTLAGAILGEPNTLHLNRAATTSA